MNGMHSYPAIIEHKNIIPGNVLLPDLESEIAVRSRAEAIGNMCWTCGSCDSECPVNIATGRLRPQKIIRLANLGLMEELLSLPEIWYCISCRRCLEVCPNLVKPATAIAFARYTAVEKGVLPMKTVIMYRKLFSEFQRVRWRAIEKCLKGDLKSLSENAFQNWLGTPVQASTNKIDSKMLRSGSADFRKSLQHFNASHCFTCGECSSACPISCEQSVFDARTIFRMANLGLLDELLISPSLWLCINCGRCSDACSQHVDGRSLIELLRQMAFEKGVVERGFKFRLEQANKRIYSRFLSHVDSILLSGSRPDLLSF
jgi:heterodisulfide reductase subunit C